MKPGDKTFGAGGPYVVLYNGTARSDGSATVALHGSTFAPLLMVGLKDSAGNVSGSTGATETFNVTKGTVYFFAATSDPSASAQPLVTGSYTLTFSDILQNVQQGDTINASAREASDRAASGDWAGGQTTPAVQQHPAGRSGK